jgi:hypothetical protein
MRLYEIPAIAHQASSQGEVARLRDAGTLKTPVQLPPGRLKLGTSCLCREREGAPPTATIKATGKAAKSPASSLVVRRLSALRPTALLLTGAHARIGRCALRPRVISEAGTFQAAHGRRFASAALAQAHSRPAAVLVDELDAGSL